MISKKVIFSFALTGLIVTCILFIYSFFISFDYRIFICIPVYVFTYLMGYSIHRGNGQVEHLAISFTLIIFICASFGDFFQENYYKGDDWRLTKGIITEVSSGKRGEGIYYSFMVDGRKMEDVRSTDVFNYFRYKAQDSIQVVYAASEPFINDIYAIGNNPDMSPRKPFILYFIRYDKVLRWVVFFALLYFLCIYDWSRGKYQGTY
ncbi:MAG: hypothetical protein H7259_08015 [Cytophagales bacterium]|nr:hypothetical protein [Cytophaga sp.]